MAFLNICTKYNALAKDWYEILHNRVSTGSVKMFSTTLLYLVATLIILQDYTYVHTVFTVYIFSMVDSFFLSIIVH